MYLAKPHLFNVRMWKFTFELRFKGYHLHLCPETCTHKCTHTNKHRRTHTHTHTHTHTQHICSLLHIYWDVTHNLGIIGSGIIVNVWELVTVYPLGRHSLLCSHFPPLY